MTTNKMSSQTVFVQFRYCPLCRINHKKGKKHVHSKRHQDILAIVLSKLLKKIAEAREFLKKPSVRDITWDQAEQKFWCYFCLEDVNKHRQNMTASGDCVIEYGGLLEHITRTDHLENTTKFLKENKLDMKRTPEFIISAKVYLKYLEDIETVCSQFFVQKSLALKQVAAQIRSQSVIRHDIVTNNNREQILQQQGQKQQQQPLNTYRRESTRPKSVKDSVNSEEKGKKTVQAFGEGLTPIDRLNEDDLVGNIYTNAVPPWMQPDDSKEISTGVIGPTEEDLEKYRKLERKRLLPACRVGAKFDRKSDQTDSWLPNFGGVWNHGRRTKSGHQFLKRQSRKAETSFHSSTTAADILIPGPLSSFQNSSYSFPKIAKRTATIISDSDSLQNRPNDRNNVEFPFMNTDSPSSSINILQNSDSFYNQSLKGANSQPLTSDLEMSHTVHNSSLPVSSSVNNDSCVIVKPYVKKHRSISATFPEQNSVPVCPPQIPVYYPADISMNPGNMNSFSTNRGTMPPSFLPYNNHMSSIDYERNRNMNGASYPVHNYNRQYNQFVVGRESDVKFRLISTPVLNKDQRKEDSSQNKNSLN